MLTRQPGISGCWRSSYPDKKTQGWRAIACIIAAAFLQLMLINLTEMGEIEDSRGIIGQHFKLLSLIHCLDGTAGFQHRQRAFQPPQIKRLVRHNIKVFHNGSIGLKRRWAISPNLIRPGDRGKPLAPCPIRL